MLKPTEDSKGIRLGGLRRIRGIIDEELETVWSGAKTPLDALNAAVRRGNQLLEPSTHGDAVTLDVSRNDLLQLRVEFS